MRSRKLSTIALTLLTAAVLAWVPNSAHALVLYLGVGNAAIAGYAGPYGTVTVTLDNAHTARVVFQSNTVAGNIYLFGNGGSIALNFNGAANWAGDAGSTYSNAGTGFTPGPFSDGGAGNEDGFGVFSNTLNDFDGYTASVDYFETTFTKASGNWASEADVLAKNAMGASVAAHIFVTSAPADRANGALATGYATDNGVIPEPLSLTLLGGGLLTIGALRTRKKKS